MTVVGPTWSTAAITPSTFYIYASAADIVTLPPQAEVGFNSATYTHELNLISSPTYLGSSECNTLGDDACYTTSTNVLNLSNFSADFTSLSAITFTVNQAIIDRSYLVATWRIVHRIKTSSSIIGFKAWEISFVENTPIWSTAALTQTTFYIYSATAATITLPAQTVTGFNTATFTHTINVISTPTFTGSAACSTTADDTCYITATEANSISAFSAVLTNLSAITFTVNAAITDRSYLVSTWKIVHRIKHGTSVLGFKAWEISFSPSLPTWTGALTPNTSTLDMVTSLAMSLPVSGSAVFHDTVVFTQNIYVIKEAVYLANTSCLEG